MGGRGPEKLTNDASALPVETDVPAQIGVDAVVGQGTQQDDERQDGQQQRGPEQDDRVAEVQSAELSEEVLGCRPFEAAPCSTGEATSGSTGTGPLPQEPGSLVPFDSASGHRSRQARAVADQRVPVGRLLEAAEEPVS